MSGIEEWIALSTAHIAFPPDRKPVAEEIRASYEDHRDALIEAGETEEQASRLALEALARLGLEGEPLGRVRSLYPAVHHYDPHHVGRSSSKVFQHFSARSCDAGGIARRSLYNDLPGDLSGKSKDRAVCFPHRRCTDPALSGRW